MIEKTIENAIKNINNADTMNDLFSAQQQLQDAINKIMITKANQIINNANNKQITVNTNLGNISAYTASNGENDGIFLMYNPKGTDVEIDLAYVETLVDDNKNLALYTYGDVTTEDYTNKHLINHKQAVTSIIELYTQKHIDELNQKILDIDTKLKSNELSTDEKMALLDEKTNILNDLLENTKNTRYIESL